MNFENFTLTIDGRPVEGVGAIDVVNPATGKVFAKAPDCSAEQLDAAIAAARRAQQAWAAVPLEERRSRVAALGKIIAGNLDSLTRLLSQETGKPLEAATGELMGTAYWFETAADLQIPVTVLEDTVERRTETRHVPLGVVGAILPWNFPVLVFSFKVIPALIAGNTIVCKPSPYTPLTTLALGKMLADALPAGVLNVVSGGDDLGRWMTEHKGIDKIGFTGSTATGKRIVMAAADTMKRLSLELGGNDAAIVLPDVDIKAVSEALFWGAFKNSGQVCVAAKRIYVHEDIFEPFVSAMAAYAKTVKMGDPTEQGTQLGPVQNKMQYQRVKDLIADSRVHGHTMHTAEAPEGEGFFIPVTIVENPPEWSRVVVEEAFGPVVPVLKFGDLDDVIARANNTDYGLAGSVWCQDEALAEQIASRMQCGTVWINTIQDSLPVSPIAGHKQSGLGVENGNPGLLEYTNTQTITRRKKPAAQLA